MMIDKQLVLSCLVAERAYRFSLTLCGSGDRRRNKSTLRKVGSALSYVCCLKIVTSLNRRVLKGFALLVGQIGRFPTVPSLERTL